MAVLGSFLMGRMILLGILPASDLAHLSWIPGLLAFIFLVHAGVFVDSQSVKRERDATLGAIKTANEVLLSERKLREEQAVFFSFVAHELRSPLAAIIIGVKNLENELTEVCPQVLARIRRITGYAERMGNLIDRNLTLQRLANADFSSQFALANLRQMAEEVLRRVRMVFVDSDFTVDYAQGLPTSASLDQELLLMGLENLLINAAKFGPASGAIGLEIFSDSALHFCVSDRGPGIQPDQIGRMFSVFSRMQKPGFKGELSSGFGIGLAIVQRVAHAHGGTLKYADRLDGGAVFTLSIPLASDRAGSIP
jgi:signal transduction histidine kinase